MTRAEGTTGFAKSARQQSESMTDLKKLYNEKVAPKLSRDLNKSSVMAVPKLLKVVVSVGLGEATKDGGVIEKATVPLVEITGMKPAICKARMSISTFGLRQGEPVGLKVTLRGNRMYDFLEKLFKIVLPRLRDFQGVSLNGFDKTGNYNLGITEQTVFPEVDFTKLDKNRGLQITIVTSSKDKNEAKELLEALGMPFEKRNLGNG